MIFSSFCSNIKTFDRSDDRPDRTCHFDQSDQNDENIMFLPSTMVFFKKVTNVAKSEKQVNFCEKHDIFIILFKYQDFDQIGLVILIKVTKMMKISCFFNTTSAFSKK